jgi:hypothetical protein
MAVQVVWVSKTREPISANNALATKEEHFSGLLFRLNFF